MNNYHYPKTKKEWWDNVYEYWDDIVLVMGKYVRLNEYASLDGELDTRTLLENAILAKKAKNSNLHLLFQRAWWQAPDHPKIFNDVGWGILCDLCSEGYLLSDDDYD